MIERIRLTTDQATRDALQELESELARVLSAGFEWTKEFRDGLGEDLEKATDDTRRALEERVQKTEEIVRQCHKETLAQLIEISRRQEAIENLLSQQREAIAWLQLPWYRRLFGRKP